MEEDDFNKREELLFMCKINIQCERYDQLYEHCLEFAVMGGEELSLEEREYLAAAFKNVVGEKRSQWRILNEIEEREK